jgi:pimeloyl-ACP methyl ester carboxylesterase
MEELFADLDGARMRYLRAGSGPPLVLIHGLMGYSFSWRFTIPALSPRATVYAVDLLGAGYSDRPTKLDRRMRPTAQRLLRFLDAAGISSFDLLGTSHGGAVAMCAASLCQRRRDLDLRQLILVAPVNPWSAHGRLLAPLVGSPLGSRLFVYGMKHMHWTYPFWLARLYGDRKRIPPGTLAGYVAPTSLPYSFEHGTGIVKYWTEDLKELESVIPSLENIRTLLIWGSADAAVDPRSGEKLRQHFRECDLVVFPGVGHLPYEEDPERFNAVLIEFLARGGQR